MSLIRSHYHRKQTRNGQNDRLDIASLNYYKQSVLGENFRDWCRFRESIWSGGELSTVGSSQDIEAIIQNVGRLEGYSRVPDCFQQAAVMVKSRCSELEMHEEERIKAAISMTLCELRTGRHSPPMECLPFSSDFEDTILPAGRDSHRSCVEALSRSAQYWSSYSGYLREVHLNAAQLCFAFRRWNDIDTAKDIYQNITLDKLELLRLLLDREHALQGNQALVSQLLQDLTAMIANVDGTSASLSNALQLAIGRLEDGSTEVMSAMQVELLQFRRTNEEDSKRHLDEVSLSIHGLFEQHTTSLESLMENLESAIQTRADAAFSPYQIRIQELADFTLPFKHSFGVEWQALSQDVTFMRQTLQHLTLSTHSAMIQFEHQARDALSAHLTEQQIATDSAQRLSDTLTDLAAKTREEMNTINSTAAAVREGILRQSQGTLGISTVKDWLATAVFWLLEIVLRIDSRHLEYLLPCFGEVVSHGPRKQAPLTARWLSDCRGRSTKSPSKSEQTAVLAAEPMLSAVPRISRVPDRLLPSAVPGIA
ncbi:hypothetical protein EIP91_004554 [Steccherinum ochraceum]|uniref:Nuclear fusion protein KAR5 n=1 Tax=Steccherinum ochraceum TaxID=92696 RepID=A0A4R0R9B0_9APHY|nr:hypothetical protein EIP91_004554 [Steccherinum ochraceum]